MCTSVPFHTTILLRNGAVPSSHSWSITTCRHALSFSTHWKVFLSGLTRSLQSWHSKRSQSALGMLPWTLHSWIFPSWGKTHPQLTLPAGWLKSSSRDLQGDALFFSDNCIQRKCDQQPAFPASG